MTLAEVARGIRTVIADVEDLIRQGTEPKRTETALRRHVAHLQRRIEFIGWEQRKENA